MASKLQILQDLDHITSRLFPPGFASQALHLGPGAITADTLSFDEGGNMTLRYTIPEKACHSPLGGRSGGFSLSGLLAVLDEVTTWAIIATDRSRRPGLSTALNVELGPAGWKGRGMSAGDVVDIKTRVVKIGRYMGFVNAEVVDVSTGNVICVGTHTKFMPMGFTFWMLMGPLFPVATLVASIYSKPHVDTSEKGVSIDNLVGFQDVESDPTKLKFSADHRHMNPAGVMHGGCQGMLMELLGHRNARKALDTFSPRLHSINITFMSPATKSVVLESGWIQIRDDEASMKVKASRPDSGRVISEAFLKWTKNITIPRKL